MSTREVTVKLRISSDLHESVVLPNQKKRRLSPLIVALLEAYVTNGYVQNYVDESIMAGFSSVDPADDIAALQEHLMNLMSMCDDQELTLEAGRDFFQEQFNQFSGNAPQGTSADPSNLEVRVANLEASLAYMRSLLEGNSTPVAQVAPSEPVSAPTPDPTPIPAPASPPPPAPSPVVSDNTDDVSDLLMDTSTSYDDYEDDLDSNSGGLKSDDNDPDMDLFNKMMSSLD